MTVTDHMSQQPRSETSAEHPTSMLVPRALPSVAPAGHPRAAHPIRVLVAIGDELVRHAVPSLLAGDPGVEVTGQVGTFAQAQELLRAGQPEVLVVDRRLADGGCPWPVRGLHAVSPETSVVVIGMDASSGSACQAIGAGASAYVLMDVAEVDLVAAVRVAAGGGCYVSPPLSERLRAQLRAGPRKLSELQIAVLRELARGRTDAEVALQLSISVATLDGCRAEIYRRLGIASRAELAGYGVRHGLLAGG